MKKMLSYKVARPQGRCEFCGKVVTSFHDKLMREHTLVNFMCGDCTVEWWREMDRDEAQRIDYLRDYPAAMVIG